MPIDSIRGRHFLVLGGSDGMGYATASYLLAAGGIVTFADPDMHFEGGLVMIDHGQGWITAYLHQSKLEVSTGQQVVRGQKIGEVGMRGRATGPHLCWRLTWRKRHMDPTLMLGARAPGIT